MTLFEGLLYKMKILHDSVIATTLGFLKSNPEVTDTVIPDLPPLIQYNHPPIPSGSQAHSMPPADTSLKIGVEHLTKHLWEIANPRVQPRDVETSFMVKISFTDQATNANSFSATVSTNLIHCFLMTDLFSNWKTKDDIIMEFSLTLKAQLKNKHGQTHWDLLHRTTSPGEAVPRPQECLETQLHFPSAGLKCSQNLGREVSAAKQTLVC